MNVIEKMHMHYDQMTASEKKVFVEIVDDPSLIVKYTIGQIASYADTSTSAVLRFCQRLGYKGYKDFRYDILDYLKTKQPSSKEADLVSSLSSLMAESIHAIDQIDRSLIEALTQDILQADKVILLGKYRNQVLTSKLRMNLMDLDIVSLEGNSDLDFRHLLYVIHPDTCVIRFSMLGSLDNDKDFFNQLASQTDHLWLITTSHHPSLLKYTKNIIQIPSIYNKDNAHVTSHCIVMAFTEILTAYIAQMKEG